MQALAKKTRKASSVTSKLAATKEVIKLMRDIAHRLVRWGELWGGGGGERSPAQTCSAQNNSWSLANFRARSLNDLAKTAHGLPIYTMVAS